MNDALLRQLTDQIVRELVLQNWKFWLVLLAVTIVVAATSAFGAAYLAKRGQNRAVRADLKGLLAQLRATTDATERVRVAILYADWSAKEWMTVRRAKLEELFCLVYESDGWIQNQKGTRVFGNNTPDTPSPISKLELVSRLYFPELLVEVLAISVSFRAISARIENAALHLHAAAGNLADRQVVFDTFVDEFALLYKGLLDKISALENKAPEVIKDIIGA